MWIATESPKAEIDVPSKKNPCMEYLGKLLKSYYKLHC